MQGFMVNWCFLAASILIAIVILFWHQTSQTFLCLSVFKIFEHFLFVNCMTVTNMRMNVISLSSNLWNYRHWIEWNVLLLINSECWMLNSNYSFTNTQYRMQNVEEMRFCLRLQICDEISCSKTDNGMDGWINGKMGVLIVYIIIFAVVVWVIEFIPGTRNLILKHTQIYFHARFVIIKEKEHATNCFSLHFFHSFITKV